VWENDESRDRALKRVTEKATLVVARLQSVNSQNSKMWSAENSHALQETPVHLSVSWKWNGIQCSLKLVGRRTFTASAVITHCLWHYWCLWKYKNKINGLQCGVGTSCICILMRSIFNTYQWTDIFWHESFFKKKFWPFDFPFMKCVAFFGSTWMWHLFL